MKKSEMYKLAQKAVLLSQAMMVDEKLEVLRELMNREDTAKFVEEQEEKANAKELE